MSPRKNPFPDTIKVRPPGTVAHRPPRFKKSQVREALRKSGGFVSYAAKRLQCHPNTVFNYLKRHPDLAEDLQIIKEGHIDLAESSLLQQIGEKNTQATIFYLECQGKKRGYVRNPALNLHAHVDAGSGTWTDIMKRVAKECGGEINAASAAEPKLIDVTPVKARKALATKC